MITIRGLHKRYRAGGRDVVVANGLSTVFPQGQTVALLGRNGAGKSSLLRMIAGVMDPDAGQILARGSVSWPVGFAGAFHPDLIGAQNARFIARVYGVSPARLSHWVRDFAELGPHMQAPMRGYSAGMKARFAFAASMGIDFDTYLVDEVTSVGDAAFKRTSEALFADRMRARSGIIVTHALGLVQRVCDAVAILDHGRITYYEDVDRGILHHQALLKAPGPLDADG